MSDDAHLSRRRALQGAAGVLLAIAGGAACKRESAPFACNDTSRLSAEEAAARTALGYVDTATQLGTDCDRCQQWTAPPSGEGCGGCKLLRGPIHPKGSCRAYSAKG